MSEQAGKKANEKLILLHYGQAKDFFIDNGQPEYAGCVQDLEQTLVKVVEAIHGEYETAVVYSLPMFPPGYDSENFLSKNSRKAQMAGRGHLLYCEEGVPQPTQDLLLLNDVLTHSRVLQDNRNGEGRGKVLSVGYYDDERLYFIETHSRDNNGDFMTWAVSNQIPGEFITVSEVAEPEHYLTTGESMEMTLDFYGTLKELPTIEVDELDLIGGWVSRKAA